MKKILKILIVAAISTLLITTTAFAKPGKGNPSGVVTAIDPAAGTLTMQTTDSQTLVVTLPADFDYDSVAVGDTVTAKGTWTDDGTAFTADWVKQADPADAEPAESGEDTEGSGEGNGNAWGQGGVYCAGGKENQHPFADKLAEKYPVDAGWVMEQVCSGHTFGAIVLALKTQEAGGPDVETSLSQRKEGKGWGQIWKEAGIAKSDKSANPPPGWLNRPDKDKQPGPPEGKGPENDNGNNGNNGSNGNNGNNGPPSSNDDLGGDTDDSEDD